MIFSPLLIATIELLFIDDTSQDFLCMSERLNSLASGVWYFIGVCRIWSHKMVLSLSGVVVINCEMRVLDLWKESNCIQALNFLPCVSLSCDLINWLLRSQSLFSLKMKFLMMHCGA